MRRSQSCIFFVWMQAYLNIYNPTTSKERLESKITKTKTWLSQLTPQFCIINIQWEENYLNTTDCMWNDHRSQYNQHHWTVHSQGVEVVILMVFTLYANWKGKMPISWTVFMITVYIYIIFSNCSYLYFSFSKCTDQHQW